jgi:hypothetical protein
VVPLRVLSRTSLAESLPSTSFTSSISFTSFRLPPLCISSPSFSSSRPWFSTTSRLFFQNTRGGGTLAFVCEIAVQSFSVASVPQWQIPFLRKSFRMNTCKSASKQTTLTPLRMNTCEKHGGGGAAYFARSAFRGEACPHPEFHSTVHICASPTKVTTPTRRPLR